MQRLAPLALMVCLGGIAAPAEAVPVQITVQATLTKDEFSDQLFGIIDPSVPVQVSFVVETDAVTTFAAGTLVAPYGVSSGADLQLVGQDGISNFVATFGNATFTQSDLVDSFLGATGLNFGVLLVGNLAYDNGLSGAMFSLANSLGNANFGGFACVASCLYLNNGSMEEYSTATVGVLGGVQTFARLLPTSEPPLGVPEPTTFALLGLGLAGVLGCRRKA